MSEFYIRDKEAAQQIVEAYEKCSRCDTCILNTPAGWHCSYQYERAIKYLQSERRG